MGRGLGWMQRAALTAVSDSHRSMYLDDLAEVLGLTPRRCRALVAALRDRGEVDTELVEGGRIGEGQYGPIVYSSDKRGYVYSGMPTRITEVRLIDAEILARRAANPLPGRGRG